MFAIAAPAAAADGANWIIVTGATGGGEVAAFVVDKASIKDGSDGKHAEVMLVAGDRYADYLMVFDCKGYR